MKTIQAFMIILFQFTLMIQACSDDHKSDYLVTITTTYGEIKAILFDATPKHKENFLKLVKEGFYDSLLFHRVMKDFMIQTGDPDSKGAAQGKMLGNGGPGYTIPAEFSPLFIHQKGAIAAARQSDNVNPNKESSGSQFYIVQGKIYSREELIQSRVDFNQLYKYFNMFLQKPENKTLYDQVLELQKVGDRNGLQRLIASKKDSIEKEFSKDFDLPLSDLQIQKYTTVGGTPHLDGAYTVFGQVIAGMDVIDKIAAVSTDPNNRPVENIIIKIGAMEMPRKKISKLYGYQYPDNNPGK